jgi:hypothetical protein
MLRAGNAGSNTAADHIVVIREALRQLPFHTGGRIGRKVLVRIDGAGATHDVSVARRQSTSVRVSGGLPLCRSAFPQVATDRQGEVMWREEGR